MVWTGSAAVFAFVTGATMLGGQVAWMRLAQAQVGTGLLAGALSLSAAMAGLALGAAAAGRLVRQPRLAPPLLAAVQQFLAVLVLAVSPWLINCVGTAAASAARAGSLALATGQLLLAACVGLVLLILNVPFGMALPLAVGLDLSGRQAERPPTGRRGGLFYALQSAGAVLGAIVLGLILPAEIGFVSTCWLAGLVHLPIVLWLLVLIWAGRGARQANDEQADPAEDSAPGGPASTRRTVLGLALLLGMLGLGAELVWLRGLGFLLRGTVYVYGLTTAAFVAGLTAGGLVGAYLAPLARRSGQVLAGVVLLASLVIALSAQVLDSLPTGGDGQESAQRSLHLVRIVGLVAPGAAVMGVAFPLLLRLAGTPRAGKARPSGQPPREQEIFLGVVPSPATVVARVAAFNSVGAMLGPLLAYGLLLDLLDIRRSILAIAVGYLLAALWAELLDPATGWHRSTTRAAGPTDQPRHARHAQTRRQRLIRARQYRIPWINMVLFVAAVGVCLWQARKESVFRDAFFVVAGRTFDEHAELHTLSLPVLIESRQAVVAVRRNTSDGLAELLIDREVQGDDSPLALRVQGRQSLLALALASRTPQRALVIGLGTGSTAAPLVAGGVEQVTVAELVGPVIPAALDQFQAANGNLRNTVKRRFEPAAATQPTTAPAEPQVVILPADGRSVLRLHDSGGAGWDLVLVDIIYPTTAGAGGLFSEQFYRLAHDRLADDGLFVHWLPLWQISPEDAVSVVAAFLRGFAPVPADRDKPAFRAGLVFVPDHGRPMVALVGARPGNRNPFEPARLARRLGELRQAGEKASRLGLPGLAELELDSVEQVLAGVLPESMLMRWAGAARPATDSFPCTELRGALRSEAGLGAANIDRLLKAGYGGSSHVDELLSIVGARNLDRPRLAAAIASRRLLAEAARLPLTPANSDALADLLDRAVKTDEHNQFARLSLDRIRYESALDRAIEQRDRQVVQAWRDGRRADFLRAAAELIPVFERIDGLFGWDLRALEEKAALEKNTGRLAASGETLDEMIRRAPRAADPRYLKAQVLLTRARESAGPDRSQLLQDARAALKQARALRTESPDAYDSLAGQIRAELARPAAQPTSSPGN